jgi:hypothetical protein
VGDRHVSEAAKVQDILTVLDRIDCPWVDCRQGVDVGVDGGRGAQVMRKYIIKNNHENQGKVTRTVAKKQIRKEKLRKCSLTSTGISVCRAFLIHSVKESNGEW